MFFKRVALPFPPNVKKLEAMGFAADIDSQQQLEELIRRREDLNRELELLDAEVHSLAVETICGNRDETQHVELYDGALGVTRAFVDAHERPIGQLQWLDDLANRFSGPGESPGDVSGVRWGSGGLISDDLFITAGHCFDSNGGGWTRPQRNGRVVSPQEIASLMRVNFNYQINGVTNQVRPGESFPIIGLIDYRLGGLDFAIVRLGKNANNVFPGQKFGRLAVASQDLTDNNAMLCVIQHPNGSPKKVEAGPMQDNRGGRITYDSIDTLGGSSGAPILSLAGEIIGVHTDGGCSAFSGFNYGVAIEAIRRASSFL